MLLEYKNLEEFSIYGLVNPTKIKLLLLVVTIS